jgi:voltage-gated potassium channel
MWECYGQGGPSVTTGQKRNPDSGGPSLERSRVGHFLDWARNADAPLSIFLGLIVVSTVLAWSLWEFLPPWAFDVFFVATMIFGVIVLVSSPRLAILAGLLGVVAIVYRLAGSGPVTIFGTSTSLAFFLLVGVSLLRRVFRPGQVTVHRLTGAVALFVVLAVTWGFAYQIVCLLRPGALLANGLRASPQDAMWFSFVTITTVGYGDVVPAMPIARSLAGLEALTGVLYPAVLIGMLLGDFTRQRPRDHEGR